MAAIDSLYPVETPDGIELSLHVAGPVMRAFAWLIDFLIRAGFLFGLAFVLAWLNAFGMALLVLAWFLIDWWYPVLFEVFARGATPGKKALGLKVINQDGTPVGWGPSIIRNLLRQVDFLPVLYATGLVTMLCNRRFQRLGDLAAATVVVYQETADSVMARIKPGPSAPPPIALDASEQQALLSFAERALWLNPQRAAELAEELAPLSDQHGAEAVEQTLAWARHIRGQQA